MCRTARDNDDELLGAPAALFCLRDAGYRVVNLACSYGRQADRTRRRGELAEALKRARIELAEPSKEINLHDISTNARVMFPSVSWTGCPTSLAWREVDANG